MQEQALSMDDSMETTSTFKGVGGLNLFYRAWLPEGEIRALIVLLHGLGDHSGGLPYRNFAAHFVARGFAVYSFDLRGHGQSEGHRMFAESMRDIREDVRAFVSLVMSNGGEKPLFIVAQSLGGLIAFNYAQYYPADLKGLVTIAPALDDSGTSPLLRKLMPFIARLMPKAAVDLGLDLSSISRDTSAVKEYTSDTFWQTKITPRLAVEVLHAIVETRANARQLRLPYLILQGTADKIVPAGGVQAFHQTAGSTDKTYRTYDGAYHNLFIETNRAEVFNDITQWLAAHL